MIELNQLTIEQAHQGLKTKKFSAVELTQACFSQIKKADQKLHAFVLVREKEAEEEAKKIDQKIRRGEEIKILEGIPAAIKDNFNTRGVRTTCCSKILENFVPPYDATVIKKLREQGAVMLGKTNLDEFACGGSTEHSCFGPTRNPWDLERVAGGSSGGSAAAVAAHECIYALGTDTGGSIRQPASLCGCVGLKVTYGRVSRFGVTAMASSLDTIGPLAKTVSDIALILNVIAGPDPYDSTTPPQPVPDYTKNLGQPIKGLKIGVPQEYFGEGLDPEVKEIVWEAIRQLEKQGAVIKEISLPCTKYAVAVYYIVMPAELSANLARYDGIRFGPRPKDEGKDLFDYYCAARSVGFGDEIKRRIMLGTYALSAGYYDAYYLKAQKVRTLIIRDFEKAFQEVDVMATPVSPFPAYKIGEKIGDPLAMYLADALTIPPSIAGIPGLSVPCGFTKGNLPVGLQLLAPQFQEEKVLQAGYVYEKNSDWDKIS